LQYKVCNPVRHQKRKKDGKLSAQDLVPEW
jgi:hypothetical protein